MPCPHTKLTLKKHNLPNESLLIVHIATNRGINDASAFLPLRRQAGFVNMQISFVKRKLAYIFGKNFHIVGLEGLLTTCTIKIAILKLIKSVFQFNYTKKYQPYTSICSSCTEIDKVLINNYNIYMILSHILLCIQSLLFRKLFEK